MKKLRFLFLLLVLLVSGIQLSAQDPDAGKSVAQVEQELSKIAFEVLTHDDTDHKIEQNKQFITRLSHLLQRPESFNHNFDSLKTVSRLSPEDNSFRIFTWYLVDKAKDAYYAENAHYYFGLIQRKYTDPAGKTHYIVIPLMEIDRIPKHFESVVTDNFAWLGALYYKPKHSKHLLSYDGHYFKLVPKKGEVTEEKGKKELVITYEKGKFKGRELKQVDKLKYSNHKRVKEAIRYYVLTGWNGWDNKSNFKVMDILTFDPVDSSRAVFGAPIIYFDKIPKARAIFKYSDFSHFSFNTGYVKSGFMNWGKKRMLVYDHLAAPNQAHATEKYDLGPDGTYDAISYFSKFGGYFEWYRKVEMAENYEAKKHRKEMEELQLEAALNDSLTFPDYAGLLSRKAKRRKAKANKSALKAQAKNAERNLKNSGLELERKEN